MKYLILLVMLCLVGSSCQPKDLPTVLKVTKEEVLLKASHMTTESELQKAQVLLKQMHSLELDFSESVFTDDGTLQNLNSILLKDGQPLAKVSADLMTLQYKYYGYSMTVDGDNVTYLKAGHL